MIQDNKKTLSHLQTIIMLACLISGIQAGGNIYRYLIEVPAWRELNIVNWGEYSRNADLRNGIILFPAQAILSFILLIIASIIIIKNKKLFNNLAFWFHTASIFSFLGLILTFFAAPIMLSVETMDNDPQLLKQTFDHFHFWGLLRAIAQVSSFLACVIGLTRLLRIKIQ